MQTSVSLIYSQINNNTPSQEVAAFKNFSDTLSNLFHQQTQFMMNFDNRLKLLEDKVAELTHRQVELEHALRPQTLPSSTILIPDSKRPRIETSSRIENQGPLTTEVRATAHLPSVTASPVNIAKTASPAPSIPIQRMEILEEIPFKDIVVSLQRSDEIDKQFKAQTVSSEQAFVIKDENVRIFDKNGELLIVFLNKVDMKEYSPLFRKIYHICSQQYNNSTSRGDAAGKFDASTHGKKQEDFVVNKSGMKATLVGSSYAMGNRHQSSTFGCIGHSAKGKCREATRKNELMDLPSFIPVLQKIAQMYAKYAPKQFQLQNQALETHKASAFKKGIKHLQIQGTPFSTITVNVSKNGKPTTYFHRDSNDLKEVFVCLFVDGENYAGGETAFPELRIDGKLLAFDVQPGTLLMFNGGDLLHGNTPVQLAANGRRVSYVA